MKLEFFAGPPSDPDQLRAIANSVSQSVREYLAEQATHVALQNRIAELEQEEVSLSGKLSVAPPTKTRATALDLAALRIEKDELKQRVQGTGSSELLLLETRKHATEAGNALYQLLRPIPEAIKAAFVKATADFFLRPELPAQLVAQTDVHRAFLNLSQSANRQLSVNDADSLISEANLRVAQIEMILEGSPVLKWNSPASVSSQVIAA